MNRPTTEVKLLLSGYTAHVATFMTYSDRQEMAKAILKNLSINTENAKEMQAGQMNVGGVDALESQKVMLQRMTIRLVNAEGVEEPPENIIDLPDSDVDLVIAELSKIQVAKKK